ncbi:hypothetical protein CVT25_005479 [Psilocybe cyanescens]|uniref:F-box domain-containing protein n=1 Tax=Psilocybe cyanescens TaxID=93625 RepID=A0A409XS90_PSICY|nr:hypothetical protein CVT25_005479 [Psilocybe cyanescens]
MLYTTLAIVCRSFQRSRHASTETQVNEPSRAPIFKLNADLLYLIFRMNTDIDEGCDLGESQVEGMGVHRAMTTARYCSQVCHLWRQTVLSSSSIWARAIDLQELDQEADHWREEVIRRTGNAYLHITGTARGYHRTSRDFFHHLIVNHWSRVRIIDVDVYHPHVFKPETWNFLTLPSPFLQSLKLRFHPRTLSSTSILPHGSIFANDAPSLREFYVEQLLFDTRISWFSHIRCFGIFPSSKLPISVSEILEVISHMPVLESLTVGKMYKDNTLEGIHDDLNVIRRPCLQEIVFMDVELKICTAILQRLIPSPACVLDLFCTQRMHHGISTSNTADDKLAKDVLIRYFKAFFDNHLISTLTLRQWNGVYALESDVPKLKCPTYSIPTQRNRRFRVSIDHYNPSLVFDIFTACRYPSVKTLELTLDVTKPSTVQLPFMISFLQSFAHVETVIANRPALRLCQSVSEDLAVLFPSMTTFKFQRASLAMLPGISAAHNDGSFL